MKMICYFIAFLLVFSALPTTAGQSLKVVSYNVMEGFNRGSAVTAVSEWLEEESPDVVLFQEMDTDSAGLAQIAAAWNHPYACVLKPFTVYSLGLTSKWPIDYLELRTNDMFHGYILARIGGVYFMSTHWSSARYEQRDHESDIYVFRLRPLLEGGEKVVVMGDFNNPSPFDAAEANAESELLASRRRTDAESEIVENLKDGFWDFHCIEQLLELGLQDVIHQHQHEHSAASTFYIYERIDQALLSRNLASKVTAAYLEVEDRPRFAPLSDHLPQVVELDFPLEPAAADGDRLQQELIRLQTVAEPDNFKPQPERWREATESGGSYLDLAVPGDGERYFTLTRPAGFFSIRFHAAAGQWLSGSHIICTPVPVAESLTIPVPAAADGIRLHLQQLPASLPAEPAVSLSNQPERNK